MLVLSRKVGESIFIDESIRVTVVHAANGRIRLGIDAPLDVKVFREELIRPRMTGAAPVLPEQVAQFDRQRGTNGQI